MLDVAGVRGGDPGPPGPVGNRVCSRVLGNPPPEPGGGEPPGALIQKGAEGAGSRGTRMLLAPGGTGSLCWAWVPAEVGLGRGPQWPSAHFALLSRRVAWATRRGEGLCPRLSSFLSTCGLHPDS